MERSSASEPYYRPDLALVHHLGFGFHADACAPGILDLLAPVRARDGLVVEIGCGSGLLTQTPGGGRTPGRRHRRFGSDARPGPPPRSRGPDFELLRLPDDAVPRADAIVSVGHVLSYLDDDTSIDKALVALADALRPGGLLAIDLCDLEYGRLRERAAPHVRRHEDWVIMTEFSLPRENLFVREMTTFVKNADGSWRRDDEQHDNCLTDTARLPKLLGEHGVEASIVSSFGHPELPPGLVAVVGHRPR